MAPLPFAQVWRRFDRYEQTVCISINRTSRYIAARWLFARISRLGDGAFWYLLVFAFAADSARGAFIAMQMSLVGLVGLLLYKQLKGRLVRERPYISHAAIELGTTPLDRYSFPSGHTLHAVSFSTVAVFHVPELAFILVPFTLLIAMSRVVLGLHYPTDVLAGGLLGFGVASAAIRLIVV